MVFSVGDKVRLMDTQTTGYILPLEEDKVQSGYAKAMLFEPYNPFFIYPGRDRLLSSEWLGPSWMLQRIEDGL